MGREPTCLKEFCTVPAVASIKDTHLHGAADHEVGMIRCCARHLPVALSTGHDG